MTVTEEPVRPTALPALSECDLLLEQLRAVEAWTRAHRPSDLDLDAAASRESRLDLARQRDVVERQRQALVDWTTRQLRASDHQLRSAVAVRAVVVHRNEWFKAKIASGLEDAGLAVVASLENGAEAAGVVIAEQPDAVVLESKLPMLTGIDLTRTIRRYAPRTTVLAQVERDGDVGAFLEAGARTAYARRVPPADIVADLRTLLAG